MRITRWGEYGVLCALYLARQAAAANSDGQGSLEPGAVPPVDAAEIARSQYIALDYAHQILKRLKAGGVVQSIRGPKGGYRLADSASRINLRDILVAAEGSTLEVMCDANPLSEERCSAESGCGLKVLWKEFQDHIDEFLVARTLADMLEYPAVGESLVQIAGEASR